MLANLPPIHKYLPLIIGQNIGRQLLERVPEPSAITDDADHVLQYDQVMTTKLAIAYCLGVEQIHRFRKVAFGGTAIDLACGPGHMSLCIAKYLKLDRLIGIDLSPGMVETANANAQMTGCTAASFQIGDVTNLSAIPDGSCDLSTFCDAAHHLPNLETVSRVVREMDRITHPDGVVFVMDLARLRTKDLTTRYVEIVGGDYVSRGLRCFYDDFGNSMNAAWTTDELKSVVPTQTNRLWKHMYPMGMPSLQIIVGTPERLEDFPKSAQRGSVWPPEGPPLAGDSRREWQILRPLLRGSRISIPR